MLAIQELEPYIKEYPRKIKAARVAKGLTQKELSERAGVPLSAITKLNINNQDALFNCAAVCRVLDLSMDELFGLERPAGTEEQQERIHELELDNTRLAGDAKLSAAVGEQKDIRLESAHFAARLLAAICALLLVAVIGYMVWDMQITTAGLFQSTGLSIFAVVLAIIVLAAVGSIAYALHSARK